MIEFAAGLALLVLLLWVANAFSRASVATIKALLAWVAALAGLSLAGLLLLTGRGAAATSGLVLLGPLAWRFWKEHAGTGVGSGRSSSRPSARASARMSRAEALAVLGLPDGASDADVREAWVRLMRTVHPDSGGSDWLASRVNQAKDVLLQR